ncbi:UNVERIFIED_CONTAM: hypothetical protein H355_000116 [Colinus virginianus]|nr:hypothetical protein H355_000116 [Colinus virginianus]
MCPGSPRCHAWGDNAAVPVAGCGLCKRADQDPVTFGETCRQDALCIHENCLYHASGLIQRGDDNEGFFGFLLPDIEQELQRVAQKVNCPTLVPGPRGPEATALSWAALLGGARP